MFIVNVSFYTSQFLQIENFYFIIILEKTR